MRNAAASALIHLSRRNVATDVAVGIAGALSTLAQTEARQNAYQALAEIKSPLDDDDNDAAAAVAAAAADTVILSSLHAALAKELKTATAARQAVYDHWCLGW